MAAPLQQPRTCNCKNSPKCPLQGNCVKENVVYQATVVTDTKTENYVGLASNFKEWYRNHQTSFRHPSKRNETELSKYVWDLKDRKKSFRVKWRILRSSQPYSNVSKKCNLCLQEKYFIIFRKDLSSLNKRASNVCRCFPHKTIYQTQMKIRHIVKTTYISTNLSVFLRVSLTLRKTDKFVEI